MQVRAQFKRGLQCKNSEMRRRIVRIGYRGARETLIRCYNDDNCRLYGVYNEFKVFRLLLCVSLWAQSYTPTHHFLAG
jgi:hypothetical protein